MLDGGLAVDGQELPAGPLGYLGAGRSDLTVQARPGTRFLLIGGEPFGEELLMWWNFVGRTHEEVEQAREDWEAQAGLPETGMAAARYGLVRGHGPGRRGASRPYPGPAAAGGPADAQEAHRGLPASGARHQLQHAEDGFLVQDPDVRDACFGQVPAEGFLQRHHVHAQATTKDHRPGESQAGPAPVAASAARSLPA